MLPRCGASSFRLGGCFSCQGTLLGRMPAVVPLLRLNHHHHSSARALSRASKSWHSSSPLVRACCPQTRLLPEPCGSRTPELQRRFLIERFIGAGSGHPVLTFVVVIVAVPVVFWALKLANLALWQNKVIYMSWFGGKEYTSKPSHLGMDYEDLIITTADGVELNCWLLKQKTGYEDKPTVIYFSGNAGSATIAVFYFLQFAYHLTIPL